MRNKLLFLTVSIFMLHLGVSAQRMRMSTGAGIVYGTGKIPAGAEAGTEAPTILGYGLFLYPRYNFVESETGSVSIGAPLTLGLSGNVNTRSGGSLSLLADVPMTIDYNYGSGSTKDNLNVFGAFIGAGFGYTYSNQAFEYNTQGTTDPSQLKGVSYGPLAHAGFKFNIGEKIYFLRGFYKIGMEQQKYKLYGGSIGVSF